MALAKPMFRETLLELANLRDDDHARALKRFQGHIASEDLMALSFTAAGGLKIYEYRDGLRKIWAGDWQVANDLVTGWVREANKRAPYHAISVRGTHGQSIFVAPNYGILPLSLALGVSELRPKMAICGNPECPNPYFFKGRKTQRFCDRPACAAYAQREYKKNWWNEHGSERRRERNSKKEKAK